MSVFYENPLTERYAGEEIKGIFSPQKKFSTWRRLWLALAESQQELGLPITDGQLAQMREHLDDIDFEAAAGYETKLRHDVMAHLAVFGDCCPEAKPIIHLGATSCYVGDNTDVIVMHEALGHIRKMLLGALHAAAAFAEAYKDLPTLAYTHFQAAQPTTVGKRACLWAQDLLMDLQQLDFQMQHLKLLGCKGATGTAASFLALFEGDAERVEALERKIAEKMGFGDAVVAVSGQTYSRKTDYNVLSVLSGVAQSAAKFSNDIRLLSHLKEFDEPFEEKQVGSSAMAYKRNPMRSERIAALARYVMTAGLNPAITAAGQWLERSLDDSANRRIAIPEAFLATDAILTLYRNILSKGRVYPRIMQKHLDEELPFMATENILMEAVRRGGDRQSLHELIRGYSVDVARRMKEEGAQNDLLELIRADARFGLSGEDLIRIADPAAFVGLAPRQTESFLKVYVWPVLEKNADSLGAETAIKI